MSCGLCGPRGTVENPNTANVSPVPVSGRVEIRTPRPDTTTRLLLDVIFTTVTLGCLLFVPAWLAGLV